MSALNAEERQKLANQLAEMKFNKAKWKLLHMDPVGRIKYFRNAQRVGYLMTRFELPTYGAEVTLYETHDTKSDPISSKLTGDNELAEVVVEPIAGT